MGWKRILFVWHKAGFSVKCNFIFLQIRLDANEPLWGTSKPEVTAETFKCKPGSRTDWCRLKLQARDPAGMLFKNRYETTCLLKIWQREKKMSIKGEWIPYWNRTNWLFFFNHKLQVRFWNWAKFYTMIASSIRAGGEVWVWEKWLENPESMVYWRVGGGGGGSQDQKLKRNWEWQRRFFATQRCTKVEQEHRLLMNTLLQGSLGRRRGFAQSGSAIDE